MRVRVGRYRDAVQGSISILCASGKRGYGRRTTQRDCDTNPRKYLIQRAITHISA